MVQIVTFVLHRDSWFAGFMGLFVFLSFGLTVVWMQVDSKLKRFDPLTEARLCLARECRPRLGRRCWLWNGTSKRRAPG